MILNKDIIPAFDMLLEELERIIPDLNVQGKQLLDEKKYPQAHELINKAEAVVDFQTKVKTLREEWIRLQVPRTSLPKPQIPQKSQKPTKYFTRKNLGKLQEGLRTKNSDFHMPILKSLADRGGSLKFSNLIEALTIDMSDTLNKFDWEMLPDGETIRWHNNVGWAKKPLTDEGYLSTTAPKGTWEITSAGRKALEDHLRHKS